MSMDALQAGIKKIKSPVMLDVSTIPDRIPPKYLEKYPNVGAAFCGYYHDLIMDLSCEVAAIRINPLHCSFFLGLHSSEVSELTQLASKLGYYVLLDLTGVVHPEQHAYAAELLLGESSAICCDGVLLSNYCGSDCVNPYLEICGKTNRDLFGFVRSANKSAAELQDLLTGSRTVHMAAADHMNRNAAGKLGKYGYSNIGVLASAGSGDSLKMLRAKYPAMFLIVDGMEYSFANAKNCSYAFDKMGYGAILNLSSSVMGAWKQSGEEPVVAAQKAISSVTRKLSRYVSIL